MTDLATLDRRAAEVESAFPQPWLRQYSLKANGRPRPAEVFIHPGGDIELACAGEQVS